MENVNSIDYSTFNGSQFLCSESHDETVRVWNIKRNKQIQILNGNSYIYIVHIIIKIIFVMLFKESTVIKGDKKDYGILCFKFLQLKKKNNHNSLRGINLCYGTGKGTIRFWVKYRFPYKNKVINNYLQISSIILIYKINKLYVCSHFVSILNLNVRKKGHKNTKIFSVRCYKKDEIITMLFLSNVTSATIVQNCKIKTIEKFVKLEHIYNYMNASVVKTMTKDENMFVNVTKVQFCEYCRRDSKKVYEFVNVIGIKSCVFFPIIYFYIASSSFLNGSSLHFFIC
ncbi:hypothetical protein RFI_28765 [Reticulomyxa filosa]|uniref:Uncharacterized protein n=1 Tax=Reticulomyxa filosa TaxID=46433 RepID=X6M4P3_RETFI|nr:hypothetical protein RFI_28765 [Reticulomyxa filosa]|eukprot:ETO08621.1 hypothetical protein RFI_28765 [Reticulomyxa filosa]